MSRATAATNANESTLRHMKVSQRRINATSCIDPSGRHAIVKYSRSGRCSRRSRRTGSRSWPSSHTSDIGRTAVDRAYCAVVFTASTLFTTSSSANANGVADSTATESMPDALCPIAISTPLAIGRAALSIRTTRAAPSMMSFKATRQSALVFPSPDSPASPNVPRSSQRAMRMGPKSVFPTRTGRNADGGPGRSSSGPPRDRSIRLLSRGPEIARLSASRRARNLRSEVGGTGRYGIPSRSRRAISRWARRQSSDIPPAKTRAIADGCGQGCHRLGSATEAHPSRYRCQAVGPRAYARALFQSTDVGSSP
jgi:hypothetical protein